MSLAAQWDITTYPTWQPFRNLLLFRYFQLGMLLAIKMVRVLDPTRGLNTPRTPNI